MLCRRFGFLVNSLGGPGYCDAPPPVRTSPWFGFHDWLETCPMPCIGGGQLIFVYFQETSSSVFLACPSRSMCCTSILPQRIRQETAITPQLDAMQQRSKRFLTRLATDKKVGLIGRGHLATKEGFLVTDVHGSRVADDHLTMDRM